MQLRLSGGANSPRYTGASRPRVNSGQGRAPRAKSTSHLCGGPGIQREGGGVRERGRLWLPEEHRVAHLSRLLRTNRSASLHCSHTWGPEDALPRPPAGVRVDIHTYTHTHTHTHTYTRVCTLQDKHRQAGLLLSPPSSCHGSHTNTQTLTHHNTHTHPCVCTQVRTHTDTQVQCYISINLTS